MIEMTLSSRHRIRNSSPGGLRSSTLPLGQTAETGNRTPNSGVKGSGANHYPRAPAPTVVNPYHSEWQLQTNIYFQELPEQFYIKGTCPGLKS